MLRRGDDLQLHLIFAPRAYPCEASSGARPLRAPKSSIPPSCEKRWQPERDAYLRSTVTKCAQGGENASRAAGGCVATLAGTFRRGDDRDVSAALLISS